MDNLAKVAEPMSRESSRHNATLLLQAPERWSGL